MSYSFKRRAVVARAAVLVIAAFAVPARLVHAQTSGNTRQARDSAARADSTRRAGHTMPGMKGMQGMTQHAPAKPKPGRKTSARKQTSPTGSRATMTMPMSPTRKVVHSDQRMLVRKESSAMSSMHHADSGAMKMPGMPMHDSTHAMPATGKDAMAGMSMRGDSARAMPMKPESSGDPTMKPVPGMPTRDSMQMEPMSGQAMVPEPLGVPMDRAGSGTTWIPDAVSLPSHHFMAGGWDMMLHGFAFGQYDKQGGPRGGSQAGSLNWMMFMASHELFGGRVQPRTMLSLDPWTVTPRGYPLLLQTGESFHGEPLHDRQHPHDFWMELGATYERAVSKQLGFALYAAPSGEPALGPVAFMHRPSAMDIPTAPLSHHWQDATHVSFGVLTAGIFTHTWKLEGSVFNGREPDENRWDFDPIKLDSYSGRLTMNPTVNWSLSAAYGYLKSPEAHDPTQSIHRVTASAMHGVPLGTDGEWSTTLIYGGNKMSSHEQFSNSVLLESEALLDRRNTVFGRVEWIQKTAGDLVLDVPPFIFPPDGRFDVGAASAGYIREVAGFSGATIGLGLAGTLNVVPSSLTVAYGSRTPVGGLIFVRLRPKLRRGAMSGTATMHMDHTAGDPSPNR